MESFSQACSVEEVGASLSRTRAERNAPPRVEPEAADDSLLLQLARTIEYEIIPRLMLAHRGTPAGEADVDSTGLAFTPAAVQAFARLVVSADDGAAGVAIESMRARHVSVERIYTELLAPTARHLGVLWEEDLCSFTDVTIGLGRLQRLLRELSPGMHRMHASPDGRRILLLPCPGEQHTFGLLMVGEFFRRAGWDVSGGALAAGADAARQVRIKAFDAIGFSLAAEVHAAALAAAIVAVRHATCNPALVVLVGGPLFGAKPGLVSTLGADGMTIDGREAPSLAARLVSAAVGARASHG